MLKGLGVDIVSLKRIERSIENSGKVFLDKVFTDWEQEQAKNHPRPSAYLAVTFAGKEAIFKLFHIGWETGVKRQKIKPPIIITGQLCKLSHILIIYFTYDIYNFIVGIIEREIISLRPFIT